MLPEYTYRLITGVREEIKKHMRDTFYGATYPAEWMDAVLLCDVVEEDRIKVDAELAKKDELITKMSTINLHKAEELASKDAEIAELVTSLEAMVGFVSIYSDGYYRLHDTEEFKGAKDLLKRIKNET